jgi:hypothetical protein
MIWLHAPWEIDVTQSPVEPVNRSTLNKMYLEWQLDPLSY